MKRDPPKPPHDPTRRIFWWKRNAAVIAAFSRPRRKAAEARRHADAEAIAIILATALGDEDAWLVHDIVAQMNPMKA